MNQEKTIQKIKKNIVTYGIMNFEFFTPGIGKILKEAGSEFIILDQEHSHLDLSLLKSLSLNSSNPLILTRVPDLKYNLIQPCLDIGVKGIMCPKIETLEQAKKFVDFTKYRPLGKRGLAFGLAHDKYALNSKKLFSIKDKMKNLNKNILTIALIETDLGIKNVEKIMTLKGIDIGWLGHNDLSDSLGDTGNFNNPKYLNSVDKFIKACKKNKKPAGIIDTDIKFLNKMKKKGFTVIGYGHDISIFQNAYKKGLEKIKT